MAHRSCRVGLKERRARSITFGMRRLLAVVVLGLLFTVPAAALGTRTRGGDPILGTWELTTGGHGTFTVEVSGGSAYRMKAKTPLAIYCASSAAGDTIGIVEPQGFANLPAGEYRGTVGNHDSSCTTTLNLTLSGDS